MSVFYFVIMWLWFIGAEMWIFAALRSENPRLLWVAGLYTLVGSLYAVACILASS